MTAHEYLSLIGKKEIISIVEGYEIQEFLVTPESMEAFAVIKAMEWEKEEKK